jgi:hypothetical protein
MVCLCKSEPNTFQIDFLDMFLRRKHGDCTFWTSSWNKTTLSIYIRGSRLIEESNTQSSFYIYYPIFTLLHLSCCSLHLSARFIGVLGDLAGPRTTLDILLHDGSSWETFPGFCDVGWALDRSNRSLDRFSRSWSCLLYVWGYVQPRVSLDHNLTSTVCLTGAPIRRLTPVVLRMK